MTNINDFAERRQFRTTLVQTTDDDADIGSPAWIERSSRPDPFAYGLRPDPLSAQFECHTCDVSDPIPPVPQHYSGAIFAWGVVLGTVIGIVVDALWFHGGSL